MSCYYIDFLRLFSSATSTIELVHFLRLDGHPSPRDRLDEFLLLGFRVISDDLEVLGHAGRWFALLDPLFALLEPAPPVLALL